MTERWERFTDVDTTSHAASFVGLLDAQAADETYRSGRRLLLDLLEPVQGERLLDIGCGTGDDTRELARLLGQEGEAIGVDYSEAMVAEAARRAEGAVHGPSFQVADVQALPFAEASFDGCRTERCLMHVPDLIWKEKSRGELRVARDASGRQACCFGT